MLKNQVFLITGGTGSFGRAVLDHLLIKGCREIRIFSRDEKKQDEMRNHYQKANIKFYIGDVRDLGSVADAMVGVHHVFHAAALKQVPSCEFHPMEAIRTNAIGTDNVLQAAINTGVRSVVVLSTDKAAYPINAMGISKAMMEKIMIARSRIAAQKNTVLCGTRYGNVMASRGSVIPLFLQQIEAGRPITVTDPEMTRFMMTLEDAVSLVLYAFRHGKPGDLFVQKAPAATIATLAEALKRMLEADNPIQIIGTRHGEKLYETLLTREEKAKATDLGDYYRVPADTRDLNYNLYVSEGDTKVDEQQDYHSHNTKRLDVAATIALLSRLPEVNEAIARRRAGKPRGRAT